MVDRLSDSSGVLPYLYWADWRPAPDLVRIGNQFQMVHRLTAARAALGNTSTPITRACALSDFALAEARHPAGGVCCAVTAAGRTWPATGPSSDLRQWWVQLEATRALHVLANHEGVDQDARARYGKARDEQWSFVRENLLDSRYGGVWELPREPSPRWHVSRWLGPRASQWRPRLKTHGWKDPLHEVGTFIALCQS